MEKVEESDELAKFGTRDGGLIVSCTKTLGEEITPSIVPFLFSALHNRYRDTLLLSLIFLNWVLILVPQTGFTSLLQLATELAHSCPTWCSDHFTFIDVRVVPSSITIEYPG
jgi:hypothetical protein